MKRADRRAAARSGPTIPAAGEGGAAAGSPRAVAIVLLLLLLPLVIYFPALRGPFLFDDIPGVLENPGVHGLSRVPAMLRLWAPDPDVGYRPLRFVSLAIDWTLGGGSPLVFHLTNVLLHALNALLLWRLLLALGLPGTTAALAAVLFVAHPIQTEAVAYISGRKDLLCAFFYLLALHAFAHGARARGRRRAIDGALFFLSGLAAFLSKEMALTLPAAALLIDVAIRERQGGGRHPAPAGGTFLGRAWRRIRAAVAARPIFYGLLLVLGGAAVVAKVIITPATKVRFTAADIVRDVPLALQTLAWHVRKCVWPWPQVGDLQGLFPRRFETGGGWGTFWNGGGIGATAVGLLIGAAMIAVVARARGERRGPAAGGQLFFAVALLPVLNLVPLNEPAAEHYLYLPWAGLATAAAALLGPVLIARGRTRRVVLALGLLVLASAALLRAGAWSSADRFWTGVLRVNPGDDRAHNNLGLLLLGRGDRGGARREFEAAVAAGRPAYAEAYANLAALLRDDGDPEGALSLLDRGLSAYRDNPLLLSLRGGTLLSAGRVADARRDLERVASLPDGPRQAAPGWPRDRGVARLRDGDASGAVAVLEPAARVAPADASLWTNLGVALLQLERYAEAEAALRHAAGLADAPPIAHRNLAVALLGLGRPSEAAAELEQARRMGDVVPEGLAAAVSRAQREAAGAAPPAAPSGQAGAGVTPPSSTPKTRAP